MCLVTLDINNELFTDILISKFRTCDLGLDDDPFLLKKEVESRGRTSIAGRHLFGPDVVCNASEQSVQEVLHVVFVVHDKALSISVPAIQLTYVFVESAQHSLKSGR